MRIGLSRLAFGALGLAMVLSTASCSNGGSSHHGSGLNAGATAAFGTVYGVTTDNHLVTFQVGDPSDLTSSRAISGLPSSVTLVAVAFRPSTGDLFGLGSNSRIYRINTGNGTATAIGAAAFTPALSGTAQGMDFSPVTDQIRVVGNDGQNLLIDPVSGAVVSTDTTLAFDAGDVNAGSVSNVSAIAYDNNFPGATSTTAFAIDSTVDDLVTIGNAGGVPNAPGSGQMFTIGSLGFDATDSVALDISGFGSALAANTAAGATTTQIYRVDLATGTATLIGQVGGTAPLLDIAIRPASLPRIFAVTEGNNLVTMRPGNPGQLLGKKKIKGLQSGEAVVAIDFRPSTGELFGLGSSSRLYVIDTDDARAHEVGTGPFAPLLAGTDFGFDFDPGTDKLRVLSDADQNLELDPNTGAVTSTDTALAYAAGDPNFGVNPNVSGAAFANGLSGSSNLYAVDTGLDTLVRLSAPTGTGQLLTIGALGTDVSGKVGLDMSSFGAMFASMTPTGQTESNLYVIDAVSGTATLIGRIHSGSLVRDIAIEAPSIPRMYGVSSGNRLVSFRPGSPGNLESSKPITGLATGEHVVGIDFRPSSAELFAVGDSSLLYTINTNTAKATAVSAAPFTTLLSGTKFGVDFDPIGDVVRVTSDTGQNLRISPVDGTLVLADTALAYDAGDVNAGVVPDVVEIAHSGGGATLYGIDAGLDALVTLGNAGGAPNAPSSGLLFTVGSLGIDTDNVVGLDMATNGAAYIALHSAGDFNSQLHLIDLGSGDTTFVGTIDADDTMVGLAVQPSGF